LANLFAQLTLNVVLGEVSLQQEENKESVKENKMEKSINSKINQCSVGEIDSR
jgi:hypothetical protein